ncbi:MAG: hypothetical protein PHH82_03515 [Candidatus ainarchaeum sp.]|nr:hypothetical protein [Candidatus ainarchaeum sp.]
MEITFIGILYSILYWACFSAVLFFLILLFGHFYKAFDEKLKIKDIFKYFLFTLIISYIVLILAYFLPAAFGVKLEFIAFYTTWYMYLYVVIVILLKLLLYALVLSVILQPVILLGIFLYRYFVEKNSNELLSKFYVSVIISFVISLILYIFPWILGGMIAMVYF